MNYNFTLVYPKKRKPQAVSDLLRQLLIPRKWRHFLRIEKNVLINNQYRYFNELVYPGERIDLNLTHVESKQGPYPASNQLPCVIYEDQNVLVIDKPAGQKTHPNQGENNTALNDCANYLGYSPYIVHRLDMLTRGLLLVAKNPAVVPILNRELSNKSLEREYLAKVKVNSHLKKGGKIERAIGRDPFDKRKRIIDPKGKRAVTFYHVLKKNVKTGTALLSVKLATGRTHQIRVHLASIGCPIIGDPLYNPAFRDGQKLQLVAYRLTFSEPFSFTRHHIFLPVKQ